MNKTLTTMKVQGGDYAKVPTRLKAFREEHPRALVETHPTITGDEIIFKARLVKDKSDPSSAEASGHSYGTNTGPKAFEKLETIAVGRALALLGYLNNGEVASTEEMDEFYEYRIEKFKKEIESATAIEELIEIFGRMDAEEKKVYTELLASKKKELLNVTA